MKSLKYLVTLLFLGALAAPMVAQDQPTPPVENHQVKGKGQKRGQAKVADARLEQLDQALALTDDQKAKIKETFAKAEQELKGARDSDGDKKANRKKMQQATQATRSQVRAVLTDEQQKKFDAMPQERRGGKGRKKGKA
ncbi:MAG: hypothetical protein EXS38_02935 [Opitutus sp.]|nr:hypothetical protein [Opitutus sp.]